MLRCIAWSVAITPRNVVEKLLQPVDWSTSLVGHRLSTSAWVATEIARNNPTR